MTSRRDDCQAHAAIKHRDMMTADMRVKSMSANDWRRDFAGWGIVIDDCLAEIAKRFKTIIGLVFEADLVFLLDNIHTIA